MPSRTLHTYSHLYTQLNMKIRLVGHVARQHAFQIRAVESAEAVARTSPSGVYATPHLRHAITVIGLITWHIRLLL